MKFIPKRTKPKEQDTNFGFIFTKKGSDGRTTLVSPNMFKDSDLLALFVNYNTAVPSSAAIKRSFFVGKDVSY